MAWQTRGEKPATVNRLKDSALSRSHQNSFYRNCTHKMFNHPPFFFLFLISLSPLFTPTHALSHQRIIQTDLYEWPFFSSCGYLHITHIFYLIKYDKVENMCTCITFFLWVCCVCYDARNSVRKLRADVKNRMYAYLTQTKWKWRANNNNKNNNQTTEKRRKKKMMAEWWSILKTITFASYDYTDDGWIVKRHWGEQTSKPFQVYYNVFVGLLFSNFQSSKWSIQNN